MDKTLVIMRGLPWTGKSYRAKELKEAAEDAEIYSTDDFWYTQVKPEKPDEYSFNQRFLGQAHRWNQQRAKRAIEGGKSLIIIDNTNTTAGEPKPYVEYALAQDYAVRIEEPTSDRWKEISALLADKRANKDALKIWAAKLEEGSKETHSVPAWVIEKMMWRWANGLTVDMILAATAPS